MSETREQGGVLELDGRACRWLIGLAVLLGGVLQALPATSQARSDTRWAHDTTHVVTSLSLPTDTRHLEIEGPPDAVINAVDVLHYGVRAVDFEADQRAASWAIHFAAPQKGPFEVVMRVYTGAPTERATWRLTPRTGPEATQAAPVHTSLVITSPPPGRDTWAWALSPGVDASPARGSERSRSGAANREVEPPLTAQQRPRAFTLAFWMHTLHRNAVIASTWTGASETPYPLELITDPTGRLVVYHGTGARHHPVRTGRVVADGRWHYVAVTYERATQHTAVYIDGERVAYEQRPARPAGSAPLTFGQRPNDRTPAAEALNSFRGQLAWVQGLAQALDAEALHRLRVTATPHADAVTYGPWPDPSRPNSAPSESATQATLPIAPPTPISNWQAQVQGTEVVLSWTAAHDAGRYVAERSTDQTRWRAFATRTPPDGAHHNENQRRYTVTDAAPSADVVFYRVRHVTEDTSNQVGNLTSSVLKVGRGALPEQNEHPALIGNFPNPFREETTIAFELPRAAEVTLTVWTITGAPVQELAARTYPAGYHEVAFQPRDLPSGTYFVRLETGQHSEAHRMVMLR